MYKSFEAMPRNIKEEVVEAVFDNQITVDDLISLQEKKSSKHNPKEISSCISPCFFPHYWIIAEKQCANNFDNFYIVFETNLTQHQEKLFNEFAQTYIEKGLLRSVSFSDRYGIY